jgi:hypothetical protein
MKHEESPSDNFLPAHVRFEPWKAVVESEPGQPFEIDRYNQALLRKRRMIKSPRTPCLMIRRTLGPSIDTRIVVCDEMVWLRCLQSQVHDKRVNFLWTTYLATTANATSERIRTDPNDWRVSWCDKNYTLPPRTVTSTSHMGLFSRDLPSIHCIETVLAHCPEIW